MKKSAIYVRVSTMLQIDKDSLPLQRNDLINYSKFVLGIDDYEIFEDAGYSGKNTDRPKYQEMIKRIKSGEFSHLLVWKIDRISRNLLDFCAMYDELKKYNCIFVSKNEQFDTSSAMGEAMLKIILVFAELERKLTSERVTAIMLDRASKGLWNGAPVPLGYKWNKEIKFPVIDDNESITVTKIYEMYKELQSTSLVRNNLNAASIKTKKGGTWSTKTISDIIRNPFYKGTYRYNHKEPANGKKKSQSEWIVLDNNHPFIIAPDLWKECNDIMDVNALRSNAKFRSDAKTHIFASLIECGECNNNMYAKQDKAHLDGYIPSLYACKGRYNKLGCNQKTISDSIVGNFVLNFISNMAIISNLNRVLSIQELESKLLMGKSFDNVIGIEDIDTIHNSIYYSSNEFYMTNKLNKNDNVKDFNLESLNNQLKKQINALTKLDDLYLFDDADMSKKDYVLRKNKINETIEELKNKIAAAGSNSATTTHFKFIKNATTLILSKELNKGNINTKDLIKDIGRDIIKDFANTVISQIIVKDKQIKSIEFKNGLFIRFIYNS